MQPTTLTEKDWSKILSPRHPRRKVGFWRIVATFLIIFVASFAAFSVILLPATIQELKYFWQVSYQKQSWDQPTLFAPVAAATEKLQDNTIYIPKIGVNAIPIIFDTDNTNYIKALTGGVGQFTGTARPGEAGNVFIYGHSSGFVWDTNPYKEVFTLLNKLEVGDKIAVVYQNVKYVYEVTDKITVKPSQVEILETGGEEATLTLMTCTPVGTTLNRLIIQSKQILAVPQNEEIPGDIPLLPTL